MNITHVQYTVKPEYVATNRRNIEQVMSDLRALKPEGLRYATYLKADGRTFIHFALATEAGGAVLQNLPSFKKFQTELKASGPEMPPDASKLSLVDAMFDVETFVTASLRE
jgi:hypothetical protein